MEYLSERFILYLTVMILWLLMFLYSFIHFLKSEINRPLIDIIFLDNCCDTLGTILAILDNQVWERNLYQSVTTASWRIWWYLYSHSQEHKTNILEHDAVEINLKVCRRYWTSAVIFQIIIKIDN